MLARMNFASQLATNQKFNLATRCAADGADAGRAASCLMLDRLTPRRSLDAVRTHALRDYLRAGGAWTGSRRAAADQGAGLVAPDRRVRRSTSSCRSRIMPMTRREFVTRRRRRVHGQLRGAGVPVAISRARRARARATWSCCT